MVVPFVPYTTARPVVACVALVMVVETRVRAVEAPNAPSEMLSSMFDVLVEFATSACQLRLVVYVIGEL